MVRPVWHAARHSEADTSETLQSDVMRFMAILALCLVAIFALVQSLPLGSVEAPSTAQTEAGAVSQEEVAPDAGAPALPTSKKVAPAKTTAPVEPEEPPPATAGAQPPEAAVATSPPVRRGPVSAAASERDRSARPVPKVRPQTQSLRVPRTNAKPVSKPTEPRRIAALQPNASPAAVPDTPAEVAERAEQTGLSLRFASDQALLALVAQRRVQVYAWARSGAWHLQSERGALRFAPADRPKRFHHMTPNTVPRAVAQAVRRATAASSARALTWGVVLPGDIERRLKHLTQGPANGTLLIQADGRVRLAASDSGSS